MVELEVSRIRVGDYAVRYDDGSDEYEDLAGSIARVGVLVPLIVRRDGDGYVVVAGHRRLGACKRLGFDRVPCFVRGDTTGGDVEISLAENLFRADLSPVELAAAVKDFLGSERTTIDELAAAVRHHPDWVRRQVALCSWPEDVLEAIHYRKLSVAAGANLAVIPDVEYRQFLLRCAVNNGATARTTAAWLQAYEAQKPAIEAVEQPPVEGEGPRSPMVPQAPCIVCASVFRSDELSHVPMCGRCIKELQGIGRG